MHHTEHAITIDAPIAEVWKVLADVEAYVDVFPPTQAVELLEGTDYVQIARMTVDVGGESQSWVSRRELDRDHGVIHYRQLETLPLVSQMGGEWRCFPLPTGNTQLVLTHDFAVREPVDGLVAGAYSPEEAERVLAEAVDRNSHQDLVAIKRVSEGISPEAGN